MAAVPKTRAQPASVFSRALPPWWKEKVSEWLHNDVPDLDIGGMVVGDKPETACLLGKSSGVICGVPFVTAIVEYMGCSITWFVEEGAWIEPVTLVAKVTGPCRNVLMAERTALNVITRASGIATQARAVSKIARKAHWHGEIVGTRKTTPGFRMVEKYALLVGGVGTHRMNLSAMVMLKDNHIWSTGSITKAVQCARSAAGFSTKIEVECQSLENAMEACTAGADIIMLDNYTPEGAKVDAEKVKQKFPHVVVEVSGGIRPDTVAKFFSPHVDVLSMGCLTQGYPALDLSMKILREPSVPVHRSKL